jgi:hypothetical protein
MALNQYRATVPLSEVPDDQIRHILQAVLNHLRLEIIREQTPDYESYELQTICVDR